MRYNSALSCTTIALRHSKKIKVYLKLYNKQMVLSEQQALTKYREDIRMIRGMKQNVVCVFIMCNSNNSYSIYLENEKWVFKEEAGILSFAREIVVEQRFLS